MLQEAARLHRQHKRAAHVRCCHSLNCFAYCQARLPSLHPATPFIHNPKTLSLARKTHLAFITKLNLCLSLRCDCLRDGDTEGVTADNMQTLRKPLEKCLLGACPVFPFDLADQPVAAAVAAKGAQAAAGGGVDQEGGTLVRVRRARCFARSVVVHAPASAPHVVVSRLVLVPHPTRAAVASRALRRGRTLPGHPRNQSRFQRPAIVQVAARVPLQPAPRVTRRCTAAGTQPSWSQSATLTASCWSHSRRAPVVCQLPYCLART